MVDIAIPDRRGRGRAAATARTGENAQAFEARLHAALETVAPVWRALEVEGACLACQGLGWTRSVLDDLPRPAGATPLFVVVTEVAGGRPVMVLPLEIVRRRGLRTLTWLAPEVCDYAAPVLAAGADVTPGEAAAMWAAVLRALPRVDLVRIVQVPASVGARPNPIALLTGRRPIPLATFGGTIAGDPETLLGRLCRSSTLRDMGKQRRRLERAGTLRFAHADTAGEVGRVFEALALQRRRRFERMGRGDLLARPGVADFYRSAALRGLADGPVRLFGLWVDDICVATFYALHHGSTFHGLILTADDGAAWRTASPGVQIVAECLKWARARDVDTFDLSIGDLPYKREFGFGPEPLCAIVQAASLRGRAALAASSLRDRVKAEVKARPALAGGLRRFRRA